MNQKLIKFVRGSSANVSFSVAVFGAGETSP